MNNKELVWISKPESGAQGDSISLFKNIKDISKGGLMNKNGMVVQPYVSNPLLLNGLKFDLRIYVVIVGVEPIQAFICDEGLARFCTEKY